ncbi:hypothetical protein AQUCO_02300081v1 [Aquilegia coerulea]|uniref:Uncharacterized protein n=1 Tax=Aquilegia coerulea TaxID=218851 RepID=A0A2G5DBZ3_AQUCA|nr:hypothetical protein AQUCO_02300081v1 [Aquilegia coerulea]
MEEIEHGNKKQALRASLFFFIFIEGDGKSGQNRLQFPRSSNSSQVALHILLPPGFALRWVGRGQLLSLTGEIF